MEKIKVVEGLIVVDNKLLVFHHNKINKITPPIGKINENESPYQAIFRELYEELDIEVLSARCLKVYDVIGYRETKIVTSTVFSIDKWSGMPINKEPEKHSILEYLSMPEIEAAINKDRISPGLMYLYVNKMLGLT